MRQVAHELLLACAAIVIGLSPLWAEGLAAQSPAAQEPAAPAQAAQPVGQPEPLKAPPTADPGGQVARFMAVDLKALLKSAPQPAARPKDLQLQLVDYVDCTNEADIHPLLHDGLGRLRRSPAGAYRETGPAANSYFAYRFRVAAAGRPHVVVLEFPDDAERMTAIALAQPPSGRENEPSARLEFGYRTGDLLPLSGRMMTRWTFFYPTSEAPAALVAANWHARAPAALARAWIYLVADDRLPAPAGLPAAPSRDAGRYDFDPRIIHTSFGGRAENLVQAMDYLGLNELSLDALQYRRFNYHSSRFKTGQEALERLLPVLAQGGKRLVAVIDPDCSSGSFTMPAQSANMADISVAAVRNAWVNFIDWDVLKPFGDEPGLGGIMLGGPQGCAAFDLKTDAGYTDMLDELARQMATAAPALKLYQNLAGASPGNHYFRAAGADWLPIGRWEVSDKAIDRCLAEHVLDYWQTYGLEQEKLIPTTQNFILLRQCDRDDGAAYRFGPGAVPRYWLLDAVASSPGVTAILEAAKTWETTGNANVFGRQAGGPTPTTKKNGLILNSTPVRRMILLRAGDFWWDYPEMAPTLSPGGAGFWTPAAQALAAGLEPFTVWLAGAGAETALHEEEVRCWMAAFRKLPYRTFLPLPEAPAYPVAVSTYIHQEGRYLLLVNVTQAAAQVSFSFDRETAVTGLVEPIAGRRRELAVALPPGGMTAFCLPQEVEIRSVSQDSPELAGQLATRLEQFAADLDAARKAGLSFPRRYEQTLAAARDMFEKRHFQLADMMLNVALVREPGLRLRLAGDRPHADVPALAAAQRIAVDGKLDDWRVPPAIRLGAVESLACDASAANHWKGPKDLSAELYLGWSEAGLYFALRVTDDRPTDNENESALLALCGEGYQDYTGRRGYDLVLPLVRKEAARAANLATVQSGNVTIHEGFIPAAELGPKLKPAAGRTVGCNLIVCDSDDRTGMPYPWCKSNVLVWSNRQDGYDPATDAQTCGEITFKP